MLVLKHFQEEASSLLRFHFFPELSGRGSSHMPESLASLAANSFCSRGDFLFVLHRKPNSHRFVLPGNDHRPPFGISQKRTEFCLNICQNEPAEMLPCVNRFYRSTATSRQRVISVNFQLRLFLHKLHLNQRYITLESEGRLPTVKWK